MELTLTTPAILFPTISLLLLAYTNRFVAIGNRIRHLHELYSKEKNTHVLAQIRILRIRVNLIRDLQLAGISSIFFCVLTMLFLYEQLDQWAKHAFGVSLLLLLIAFGMSGWEIILSTKALNIQLRDLEEQENII